MVCTETGLKDLCYNCTDYRAAQEGGSGLEEPVTGSVYGKAGIRQEVGKGIVGEAHQQGIGAGRKDIGRISHIGADIAAEQANHRMLVDSHVYDGSQRRNRDGSGIGSDVHHDADEHDYVGNHDGRNVLHGALDKSHQESCFLTESDTESHNKNQTQRAVVCEVGYHVVQEPVQTFDSEQVFGSNHFVRCRVYKRNACNGTDGTNNGNNHEQDAEQDGWRRQFVACGFYHVHKGIQEAAFFGCVLFHTTLSFAEKFGPMTSHLVQRPCGSFCRSDSCYIGITSPSNSHTRVFC